MVSSRFSSRSAFDLSPNPLAVALSRVRARGGAWIDLTESNPTRADLPYDEQALAGATHGADDGLYEPAPFGLAAARETVARLLSTGSRAIDPARIVLTASTSEAYALIFKLLCDPGDEVLVPRPSYPLFEHLARLECVHAVPYRLSYDGAWHLDLPSVRAATSARTRAVVVVHPNNPTGSYVKRDELAALARLGLPIVSDEVFASYPLRDDPSRADSALDADEAPIVFVLGGLSKLAALPQMKLGWIAVGGERATVAGSLARLEIIADAYLSVGTPVQHALPRLLAGGAPAADTVRARSRANLARLAATVDGSAATLLSVEGGWYATLRLPGTQSEEAWALSFLEKDAVYVHPGHFFDFEGEAYCVLSLLVREEVFAEGTRRLLSRVNREA